ncbi:MAG: hypothetical protein H6942_12180 [Candidatus Accumulibacter sp.]|uniref:hypothetical protein n=1 Tax=Accumulibacter sp. TaxID=2053492 RepID=UPI0025D7161B|nr:hypothetical protein [Accumulibacter sp.]MCP5249270.1 hypothetical protein [Accumulibacter sp.]
MHARSPARVCRSSAVVETLRLKAGDEIEIPVAGPQTFAIVGKPERAERITRLREFRGRLPADFKFDRLEAKLNTSSTPEGFLSTYW